MNKLVQRNKWSDYLSYMFKYIKEILSQISPSQRLFALVILLLSISLILVGPKIVESLTHSDEELIVITNRQREQILQLNSELSQLNLEMIKNKTECTNLVIGREKEILKMIEDLQKGLGNRNLFERREMERPTGSGSNYHVVNVDTIRVAMSPPPPRQVEDDRIPMMMDGLDKIKSKLKKNIQQSN